MKAAWLAALPPCPPLAGQTRFLHQFFLPLHGRYHRAEYESQLRREKGAAARGRLLRLLGRDDEAARALAKAREPEALAVRGELRLSSDPVAGLRDLQRALAAGRAAAAWSAWAACGLALLGDFPGAGALLEGAEPPSSVLLRGLLAHRAGDFERAAREHSRLLEAAPGCPGAWTLRAEARLKLGDQSGALEDAHRAIGAHPENLDAFVRILSARAGVDLSRGGGSEALAAAAGRPGARAWLLALRSELRGRKAPGAAAKSVADLSRAAALEPRRAWLRAFLGRAWSVDAGPRELRRALAEFDAAIALEPRTGWLRCWRAEIWKSMRRPARALTDLDRGLALDPDYRLAHLWRGTLREQLGDLRGAESDLVLALDVLGRDSIASALARVRERRAARG